MTAPGAHRNRVVRSARDLPRARARCFAYAHRVALSAERSGRPRWFFRAFGQNEEAAGTASLPRPPWIARQCRPRPGDPHRVRGWRPCFEGEAPSRAFSHTRRTFADGGAGCVHWAPVSRNCAVPQPCSVARRLAAPLCGHRGRRRRAPASFPRSLLPPLASSCLPVARLVVRDGAPAARFFHAALPPCHNMSMVCGTRGTSGFVPHPPAECGRHASFAFRNVRCGTGSVFPLAVRVSCEGSSC